MSDLSASILLKLLAQRHAEDVFIPECKDGPTHDRSHLRMDAWAMPRSWSRLAFYGYEIKASRSDWLRDNKLHLYLPLCTDLYVVAAPGVVLAAELPAGVGLLEAAKTGTRLFTRVKAAHREIVLPAELFAYIIMCRTRIVRDEEPSRTERTAACREWVEAKQEASAVGRLVARKITARIGERVAAAELRADAAERRAEGLAACAEVLQGLGLDPENANRWSLRSSLMERGIDTSATLRSVQQAQRALADMEERLSTAAPEVRPPDVEDSPLPLLVS